LQRKRLSPIVVMKVVTRVAEGTCYKCGQPKFRCKVGSEGGKKPYPDTRLTCVNACELQDYP